MIKAKDTTIRKLEEKAKELEPQLRQASILTSKLETTNNMLTNENRLLKVQVHASGSQALVPHQQAQGSMPYRPPPTLPTTTTHHHPLYTTINTMPTHHHCYLQHQGVW